MEVTCVHYHSLQPYQLPKIKHTQTRRSLMFALNRKKYPCNSEFDQFATFWHGLLQIYFTSFIRHFHCDNYVLMSISPKIRCRIEFCIQQSTGLSHEVDKYAFVKI